MGGRGGRSTKLNLCDVCMKPLLSAVIQKWSFLLLFKKLSGSTNTISPSMHCLPYVQRSFPILQTLWLFIAFINFSQHRS